METTDPHVRDQLCLSMVSGVGPLGIQRLLSHFSSAGRVLSASAGELTCVPGIGPTIAKRIAGARAEIDVDEQLRIAAENDLAILTPQSADYPALLKEIPDPPGVLFARGELKEIDGLAVAIVGTRHASRYGLKQAETLGASLASAGFTVVSGMARGIDTAAHRGALKASGRTIAVLASGVLAPYPPENKGLADEIAAKGCVMSEAAPTMPPISGMFPQRNRIISGLTLGTIVVEAADRSGALITARHATEQNRQVFAVPGQVDNRLATGTNRLIRDGARLVTSIDDVLEELGPLAHEAQREDGTTIRSPAELALNEIEMQVLQAIEKGGSLIDEITVSTQMPVQRVLATVSVLEMRGLVRKVSGNRVVRV
ncbi:DNA-processing protein DprA [Bythopirellula goksoeyrii]|nr:DNA-processing protein DprA [Bythopirellula goksoeyrii]